MNGLTIIGASGFLGQSLARAALARGIPTRTVSRRIPAQLPPDVTSVRVPNYQDTPRSRERGEVLVHLAQSNLAGETGNETESIRLVERIMTLGYGQVCFASSAAVYGDAAEHEHRADEVCAGLSPYALLKLECERLVLAGNGSAARFTNLYGPGQSGASVLARIFAQIPGQSPLRLRSLAPVRDFCWIEDAANAVLDWCARGLRGTFNVGSGESVSIGALARRALTLANQAGRAIVAEDNHETRSTVRVDIRATTRACGWFPQVTLDEGIQKMIGSHP